MKSILKLSMTGFVIGMVSLVSCAQKKIKDKMPTSSMTASLNTDKSESSNNDTATFGTGCFWCTEALFQELDGVEKAVSGYAGGHTKNPTYKEVCSGETGYAECIQVTYDPSKISYDQLLEVFWEVHDPTSLNRQGADVGTQYRSVIFYHNQEQKEKAEKYKTALDKSGAFDKPIVTEIAKADVFYPAENYHQEYYELNKNSNPYCAMVIRPKLDKFRKVFKDKLKHQ